MKRFIGSLVCVGGLVWAGSTWAQERTPQEKAAERAPNPAAQPAVAPEREGMEKEAGQLRQQMGEIDRGLFAVRQRLGLIGRDRNAIKDEELVKLYDAAEKARKAAEDKSRELVKADPEGGAILTQIDDLQKKMVELQQQQRDLEKKLMGVAQRMGLRPARTERGVAPAAATPPEDPAFTALRTAAETTRKALEDKITERIKADPEGAKLIQQREELIAKAKTMTERGQEHRPERQP